MPVFAVKSGAFCAMITGGLGLEGGLLQINPIWQLAPYKPSQVSAGSQPDFYMMWTEGLARIRPAWEFYPIAAQTNSTTHHRQATAAARLLEAPLA